MSSNLKVNTILPSTGTAIGIGTASGNVDVLGHIVGNNTSNISGINSVTATTFYGSGANLTSLPAQITINNNSNGRVITASGNANEVDAQTSLFFTAGGDPKLTISGSGHAQLNLTNTSGSDHTGINFGDSADINAGMIQYSNSINAMQFHTNGSEKLRIDSSGAFGLSGTNYGTAGQVLTSQGSGSAVQWASIANGYGVFDVKHGSSAQSIPRVTYTKVEFKSKIYDLDNVFSTTDYRYTPQVAGYYYVFFTIVLTGQSSGYEIYAEIKKNGSSVMKSHSGGSQNYGSLGQADVYGFVQMNGSSDYLDSYIWHNNANSASRSPDVNYTRMGGYLVRRS